MERVYGLIKDAIDKYGDDLEVSGEDFYKVLKTELAFFMMYLSASDGEIKREEAELISNVWDTALMPSKIVDFIERNNIYSTEFENKVPISFRTVIKLDNELESNGLKATLTDSLLSVYILAGKGIVHVDGDNCDHENELTDYNIYIDMLKEYRDNNLISPMGKDALIGILKNIGRISDLPSGIKELADAQNQMFYYELTKECLSDSDYEEASEFFIEAVKRGYTGDYSLISNFYMNYSYDNFTKKRRACYQLERFFHDYEEERLSLQDKSGILLFLWNIGLYKIVYDQFEITDEALFFWKRAVKCYENEEYDTSNQNNAARLFYRIGSVLGGYNIEYRDKDIKVTKCNFYLAEKSLRIAKKLGFKDDNNRLSEIELKVKKESNYFWFSLLSSEEEFIAEPSNGYFSFLSESYHALPPNMVTYRCIVNNSELFLKKYIDRVMMSSSLRDERAPAIIQKRYGFDGEKAVTLSDIGKDFNLTRERIRQILGIAQRRMRCWASELCFMWYYRKEDDELPLNYGYYIEHILEKEMQYYKLHPTIDTEDFLSSNIIRSLKNSERTSIEELDLGSQLSIRAYNCLCRSGIDSLEKLCSCRYEDLLKISNLNDNCLKEVLQIYSKYRKRSFSRDITDILDENGKLIEGEDVLITRTSLPPKDMLVLIEKGYMYVSDYIYDGFIDEDYDDSIRRKKILFSYSVPMVRIKISSNLRNKAFKRKWCTLQQIIDNRDSLSCGAQRELDYIIETIAMTKRQEGIDEKGKNKCQWDLRKVL